MRRVCFAVDNVRKGLRAIKAGKQTVPDKLTGEMYGGLTELG